MISPPTDSPEMEAERMLLLPAGDWYGKRAHGPAWTKEFLDGACAAGSIIETGEARNAAASWATVLTIVGFGLAVVIVPFLFIGWPR